MCVKLVMLGVEHNDPLGRVKIISTLNELRERGISPDIFAVEWQEDYANKLIDARISIIEVIKSEIPTISEDTLKALSLSIAYEADSMKALYPKTPVLWLDKDRRIKYPIDDYIHDRAHIYINILCNLDKTEINNLAIISEKLWERAKQSTWNPTGRDLAFLDIIVDTINLGYGTILIIVGAKHTDIKNNDSLAALLRSRGLNIESIILQ